MTSKQEVIVFKERNGVLYESGKQVIEDTVSLKGKPNKLLDGYEYRCDKSKPLSLKNHQKYVNVLKYGDCEIHPFRCKHRETLNGKTTDCKARVHLFVNNACKTIGYCMVNDSHTNNCSKENCNKKIMKRKLINDVVDMGKKTGYEVTKEMMEHVKKQKTNGIIKKQSIQMILKRHKTKIGLTPTFTEAVEKYYNDFPLQPNKQVKIQTNDSISLNSIEPTISFYNQPMADCESDDSKSFQFTQSFTTNQTNDDVVNQLLLADDIKEALNQCLIKTNDSTKHNNSNININPKEDAKTDETKEFNLVESETTEPLELIIDKDDFQTFVTIGTLEPKPEEYICPSFQNNMILV